MEQIKTDAPDTPWTCEILEHRDPDNSESHISHSHLLMYLLQNRADDFIELFRRQDNGCYWGTLSLYEVAYTNKLLLSDTEWVPGFLPVIEHGRTENRRILEFLESQIKIPENFGKHFAKTLKPFAWFFEDEDFGSMLEGLLPELLEKGYREKDCLLYEAGLKFNFDKLTTLLDQGADPYVRISGLYTPQEAAQQISPDDTYSLYDDVYRHACDCADIYGVGNCWQDGMQGKETEIDNDLLREFFQGAGCQWVTNIILEKCPKKGE